MTTVLANIAYLALNASTVIRDAAVVVDGATSPTPARPTDVLRTPFR